MFFCAAGTKAELFVNDIGGVNSGPVLFSDGSVPSGLSYSFGGLSNVFDSLSFSNNGGATYDYIPAPDGNGCDAAVTNIKINLSGTFNAASGGNDPSFSVFFRVRVK